MKGSETFTAKIQGDSAIIVEAPSTTFSITADSTATLGDMVISILPGGSVLVHDGTSVTLHPAVLTDPASDEVKSAFDIGSSIVVVVSVAGKTFTLADGDQTTFDAYVISAASTGGAIVVDGTTVQAIRSDAPTSPTTRIPDDLSSESVEDNTATTTDTQEDSSANSLSIPAAMILTFLGFVMVM